MIPFTVALQPGAPVHEQVTYAAKKAILSGQMRPGDPFPSVRTLSAAVRINPNTAQKVVAQLTAEGFLEVHPGIGTVVAEPRPSTRAERSRLLGKQVEQLVVEAKRLGLAIADVQSAIADHWRKLERSRGEGK